MCRCRSRRWRCCACPNKSSNQAAAADRESGRTARSVLRPTYAPRSRPSRFLLGEFDVFGIRILGEILVRPGVIADGHSGGGDFPGYIGPPRGVLADLKERRLDAIVL